MKSVWVYLFTTGLLLFSCQTSPAQNSNKTVPDSLVKKFTWYNLKNQNGVLYAHFDKTVYTNNENVWFTAYLLNAGDKKTNDVLSALLVKDDDHTIAMAEKFVMGQGIALGNLFLPDTIPPGDYSFLLYTNDVSQEKPANIFVQPITIKNTAETSFTASLDLLDTTRSPVDSKRRVLLVTNAKKIIAGAAVSYFVGSKLRPLMSGKGKTDKSGQYLFNIPVAGIAPGNNTVEAQITYGKEVKNVKLILPVYNNAPSVKFYPEGGNLSDGMLSTVGWEVKNVVGNPYKVTGVLYKDGDPADTIATDSYGMGQFKIVPDKNSTYYIKLSTPVFKDSLCRLPVIKENLPVISITKAIANDTLSLIIKNKLPATINVMVHNYKQVFFSFPVKVKAAGTRVNIALDDLPRGIAEITVLDSLDRPCAERLFFAHYNQRNKLDIITDNNAYKTRQKVTLNLKLQTSDGKPATGLVSIACVQANRIEIKKQTDIESYTYLSHELGALPLKEKYMGNNSDDKQYLEDVLLVKGWRRYKWTELTTTTAADTIKQQDSLTFGGTITYNDKPLKKPANLILMRDSSVNILVTNKTGNFTLSNSDMLVKGSKKIHLFVSGASVGGYNIYLNNPYQKADSLLAKNYEPINYNHFALSGKDDKPDALTGFEHVIQLKEVKIKGSNDNSLSWTKGVENACGDYVCMYNILNCPNHRGSPQNHLPVKNERYLQYDSELKRMNTVIYSGCEADKYERGKTFNGIHYSVEFYPSDYAQYNPPEPEFLSTIYWKHLYEISPANTTPLTFYTSDITGAFKIIVQGIGDTDVISGEKTIVVSKP